MAPRHRNTHLAASIELVEGGSSGARAAPSARSHHLTAPAPSSRPTVSDVPFDARGAPPVDREDSHMDAQEALLIFYFGGAFVIFLAWVSGVGELMIGSGRAGARSIWVLIGLGFIHPASAASAWDLVRLSSTSERDDAQLPPWSAALPVLGGLVSTLAGLGLYLGSG
jgi:hypothetical protein